MSTETVLLIAVPNDFTSRLNVESLGLELCDAVNRRGGAGWAGWLETGALKVRIQRVPSEEVHLLMDAYFAAAENSEIGLGSGATGGRDALAQHRCG